jgi:hypothetical protein
MDYIKIQAVAKVWLHGKIYVRVHKKRGENYVF